MLTVCSNILKKTPALTWSIIGTGLAYQNTANICLLYFYEKVDILIYSSSDEFLSKRLRVMSKCPQV